MNKLGIIFLLFTVAFNVNAADKFKLLLADKHAKELISHLESSGIEVFKSKIFAEIEKSETAMIALSEYAHFLELTIYQADANIRNSQHTRDNNGNVYQRRYVEFSDNVIPETRIDDTPGPLIYSPNNPHADSKGMLRLPNVNVSHEHLTMRTAKLKHSIVTRVMQHLEPDYIGSDYRSQSESYDNLYHIPPYTLFSLLAKE